MSKSEVVGTITLTIRGMEVPVSVDSRGMFSAAIGDKTFTRATLADLEANLKDASRLKAVKVSVPFSMLEVSRGDWTVRDGVATGIHAGNGSVLVTWPASGRATWSRTNHEQIRGGYGDRIIRPLNADEKAELIALAEAQSSASNAFNGWLKDHGLTEGSLRGEVTAKIQAAADALGEQEGEAS